MRGTRILNSITLLLMLSTGLVAAYYLIIFIWPNTLLNPLAPPQRQSVVIVTPTPLGSPTFTLPPSWTVTLTPLPRTARPTSTSIPSITPRPTRTPRPTSTHTETITPTPTEDVCVTLELLGPPPAQKFLQFDAPTVVWTFGRNLGPGEHFDLLLDPPGAGMGSITWADEATPKNKTCGGGLCEQLIALNSIYPGGKFFWTVAIISADENRRVLGTVCEAPEPYFFFWP